MTPLFIRTILSNWRFSRMMKSYDREIAEARKAHRQVRPLLNKKRAFVEACLRGEAA